MPELKSKTSTNITLKAQANADYGIRQADGTYRWQVSPSFDGLTPDTDYTFALRVKASENEQASLPGTAKIFRTDAKGADDDDDEEAHGETEGALSYDYHNELLKNVADGYFVSTSGSLNTKLTPGESAVVPGQTLYMTNVSTGVLSEVTVPVRPATPTGLNGSVGSGSVDQYNGQITGVSSAMEYRKFGDTDWKAIDGNAVTGLQQGVYEVRTRATSKAFAGEIETVKVPNNNGVTTGIDAALVVTAPKLEAEEGYSQLTVQPITIKNVGGQAASVTKVELENSSNFVLTGPAAGSVAVDGTNTDWKVRPINGLKADTYSTNVIVTYDNGETAKAALTFTVKRNDVTSMPTITYNYEGETIESLTAGYTATTDGTTKTALTVGTSNVTPEQMLYLVKGTTVTPATVPARPVAPTGVAAVKPTTDNNNDGKLTGADSTMEYRRAGDNSAAWTTVNGNESLAPGAYEVRVKAVNGENGHFSSESTVVTVTNHDGTLTGIPAQLTVKAPTFLSVTEGSGYTPEDKAVEITNHGGANAVADVSIPGNSIFTLTENGSTTVAAGSVNNTTWTIKPRADLAAGTYNETITVKYGSVTTTAQVTFVVTKKAEDVTNVITVSELTDKQVTYTGKAITPEPAVTMNGVALVKDADYTLSYRDNTNVGTAKVIVTFTGAFAEYNNRGVAGTVQSFEITPMTLTDSHVDNIGAQVYDGSNAVKPSVVVTVDGHKLVKDTDYTVSYEGNTAVGNGAKAIVTGQGNYAGTVTKTFNIYSADDENHQPVDTPTGAQGTPTAQTITDSSVTLKTVNGVDYGIQNADGTYSWQASNVFNDLDADTDYVFALRGRATAERPASEAGDSRTFRTLKKGETPVNPGDPADPDDPSAGNGKVTYDFDNERLATVSDGYNVTQDKDGKIVINEGDTIIPGDTVYLSSTSAGDPVDLTVALKIPDRPAAPTTVVANPVDAKDQPTGTITGVDNTMQYRLSGTDTWLPITGDTVTGLAPGVYDVRVKPTSSSFASEPVTVTVKNKDENNQETLDGIPAVLTASDINFGTVVIGNRPEAQKLAITNRGGTDAANVEVKPAVNSKFDLTAPTPAEGETITIAKETTNSQWSIQPKANLPAGTYSETVTVTYQSGEEVKTATAKVMVKVVQTQAELDEQTNKPKVTYNYSEEKLGSVSNGYKVTTDGKTELTEGQTVTPEQILYLTKDGKIEKVMVPARPAAPAVSGQDATNDAGTNGKIVGADSTMEYRKVGDNNSTWTAIPDKLGKGAYEVRVKAIDGDNGSFAGEPATVIIADKDGHLDDSVAALTVKAPSFTAQTKGYTNVAAQPVVITNNSGKAVNGITVAHSDNTNFTLANSSNVTNIDASASKDALATNTSWTIKPVDGLAVGTYTDTITVTYDGKTAEDTVTFTVLPKAGDPIDPNADPDEPDTPKWDEDDVKTAISVASLDETSVVYDGTAHTPTPAVTAQGMSLTAGMDFEYVYSDNTNVGTAKVSVNFLGSFASYNNEVVTNKSQSFAITPETITSTDVDNIGAQKYTGQQVKPIVNVTVGGRTLKEGVDYDVTYGDNTAESSTTPTGSVTVKGKGNYQTENNGIVKTFKIINADAPSMPSMVPEAEVEGVTATSVTLKAVTNPKVDYGIRQSDGGYLWQSSPAFNDLSPETEYEFALRLAATSDTLASDPGKTLKVTTLEDTSMPEDESDTTSPSLTVGQVSFTSMIFGDNLPEAKEIVIRNNGTASEYIESVKVVGEGKDDFEIIQSNNRVVTTLAPNSSFKIRPKDGLSSGTHEATIEVTYYKYEDTVLLTAAGIVRQRQQYTHRRN